MTSSDSLPKRAQAASTTARPPFRFLSLVLRRRAAHLVARDNARAAAEAMVVGRREREEVEEFLEAYLARRADRAHPGVGAQVPGQRRR